MKWDQIESQWAAMTRRVRGDWPGASNPSARQGAAQRRDTAGDTARDGAAPMAGQQADTRLSETDTLQAE